MSCTKGIALPCPVCQSYKAKLDTTPKMAPRKVDEEFKKKMKKLEKDLRFYKWKERRRKTPNSKGDQKG